MTKEKRVHVLETRGTDAVLKVRPLIIINIYIYIYSYEIYMLPFLCYLMSLVGSAVHSSGPLSPPPLFHLFSDGTAG